VESITETEIYVRNTILWIIGVLCAPRFRSSLTGDFAAKIVVVELCALLLLSAFPSAVRSKQSTDPVPDVASTIGSRTAGFAQSLNSFFIENKGQVGSEVRYYARGNPAVAFRDDGVMFVLSESRGGLERLRGLAESPSGRAADMRSVAYMIRFDGANPVIPVAKERLSFDVNFFIGNDPDGWRTNVPTFGEIAYENLYDGIDLIYRQTSGGVKYELRVEPGADPGVIGMRYDGVESIRLSAESLVMDSSLGELRDTIPYSYLENGGGVDCKFVSRGMMSYGFDCGSYDRSRTLIIDPLIYSTYLTGSMSDGANAVAASAMNRAYVTGYTQSSEFPATPGAYDTDLDLDNFGYGYDAFVAEFNELGTLPFFITFLGGHDIDFGSGIALDSLGNVYVAGSTSSTDFPTTSTAFSKIYGGNADAFVTKLDSSGSFLNYSSYLGGGNPDAATSIAVDAFGNATVTGYTTSANFLVTASAWDKIRNGTRDAFVTRVFWTGDWLVYSTYLGGGGMETGYAVAVDQAGNAIITGETRSADFPTTADGTDLIFNGTSDAFVTKLNRAGSDLLFSTYLGGDSADAGYSIAVDRSGDVYVAGDTSSPDFNVTISAYDKMYNGGGSDAFVTKLNMTDGTLNYSTFLGGAASDEGRGIAVDNYGVAYVTGETNSSGFPTTRWAYDSHGCSGTWDVFVTKLKSTGDGLVFSSYLASADGDFAHSIAVDPQNGFYVVGETNSSSFPTTPGAFSTVFGGRWDGFLAKFPSLSVGDPPDLMTTSGYISFSPGSNVPIGTLVEIYAYVRNIGGSNASFIRVRFHDGMPSPTNQIGPDYIIPTIEYFNGFDAAHVSWDALVLGTHSICVVVDPEKEIDEINENNNQACASIRVFLPPTPDLVLTASNISFLPPAPVIEGTNVTISATVWNAGGAASGQTIARFLDGGPTSGRIGPDQFVDIIASGGTASVSMLWNTSRVGNHIICVVVDPDNLIAEANENNNLACVDYEVLAPGVLRADYVPNQPYPSSPAKVALSSPLTLSIMVLNAGNATPLSNATVAFYNQLLPGYPFAEFSLLPLDPSNESSRFAATWDSPATPGTHHLVADVDYENNVTEWNENNNIFVWTVEVVTGPVTSLVIGSPNYSNPVTYVKSSTPLDFSVVDQSGSGINYTRYRIDGGMWTNYTSSFFLQSEGMHLLEWRSRDNASNVEEINSREIWVDDSPPFSMFSVGKPNHTAGGSFVRTSTPLALSVADGGVGSNSTSYRLWDDSWSPWRDYSSSFNLAGRDGTWYVEFLSFDYLGNAEAVHNQSLILDNTPPVTIISPATGEFTPDTVFTLTATDSGCGVNVTRYRIDGGSLTVYVGGFTLPEGAHNISYYSNDMLNNTESERWLVVTVEGTTTPPEVAVNYKPIVAVIFAIILLVAGVWSSKKRPWKGGKERMAMVKAFLIFSLPFVLLEAATGIFSFLTKSLSIPPLIGLGTGVDLAILSAGLAIAVLRMRVKSPVSM
jgi:subtilase family serine protease